MNFTPILTVTFVRINPKAFQEMSVEAWARPSVGAATCEDLLANNPDLLDGTYELVDPAGKGEPRTHTADPNGD